MRDKIDRSDSDGFQRLPAFESDLAQSAPPSLSPTTMPNVIEFLADLDVRRSVLRDNLQAVERSAFRSVRHRD